MPETIAKQKYQAYATATQTVARTQQIVMLYDGMIRLLKQAKEAISEKRIEDRYKLLNRVSEVIVGLQSCLDFEKGGNIAKILYNFYTVIDSRIFSIHRSNSLEACDEVIGELKRMRDVWYGIDQGGSTDASGNVMVEMPKATAVASEIKPTAGSDPAVTLSA